MSEAIAVNDHTLDLLLNAQVISALDHRFARTMLKLGAEERPDVALALALTSRNVAHGHVCLDLRALCDAPYLDDPRGQRVALALPTAEVWLAALKQSELVGDGQTISPLVIDAHGRVYLHRYFDHQRRLSRQLIARRNVGPNTAEAVLRDALFPPKATNAEQRAAVETALSRRFTVITGGPGTGKTTTVVRLMAALIEQRHAAQQTSPRILLVAPTGKAAARLSESIAAQKPQLNCSDTTRAAIVEQASTIHRTLGRVRQSNTRFRHDQDRKLLCDLLIVDEASMVDLPLMRRLFDAIPDHAHVVLLGDAHQLASVEAGAVLADICDAALDDGPMRGCVAQLVKSHRYQGDSGIGRLATAIKDGDSEGAIELLRRGAFPDISWHEPTTHGALDAAFADHVRRGFAPLARASNADEALSALKTFRVLCAHRQGHGSVSDINLRAQRWIAPGSDPAAHYARQPILITHNDHRLQLFNGDVGVIMQRADGGLCASFENADRSTRQISLARLPMHETVYAMSVHKSQGSELDEVCIVLPDHASQVLTRELLYTAVTRAKRRVHIVAHRQVLAITIAEKVARSSGLADALRQSSSPTS